MQIDPCKHCGGNAVWNPKEVATGKYDDNFGFIDCTVCGVRTEGRTTKAVAIAAWSRRAASKDAEPVAWPTRRANVPYQGSETTRLVGFVIEKGDEAFGELGLSEPLAWLDRKCVTHPSTGGDASSRKLLNDIYDFLGGVDGAVELRARILTAIEPVAASPGAPDGWRLVPVEPTRDMLTAFVDDGVDLFIAGVRYKAMLEAAPAAPASPAPSPAGGDVLRVDVGSFNQGADEAIKRADQIVCEEWNAFARTKGVSTEAMVAAILNRVRALSSKQRSDKE